jgi:hypothetical protein
MENKSQACDMQKMEKGHSENHEGIMMAYGDYNFDLTLLSFNFD